MATSINGYSSAYASMPELLGPDGKAIARAAVAPPYDDYAIPHVITFQSIIGTAQRAYWHDRFDEALRDDRRNALAMRNDPQLMSLLQERILNTASLKWHLEPEDEKDAYQLDVTKAMTKIVKGIPRLRRIYRDLMEAVWYGKYAVQVKWCWEEMNGLRYLTVAKHTRVNGDKIGHRWDGTPYILVNASEANKLPNSASIYTTAGGRGVLLEGTWRERFILHYHNPDDMDFFQQAEQAEAIYGVGIRSRCYFLWWMKSEYISWLMDYLERVGLGMTIWYYDLGNEQMRKAVEREAKDNSRRSNLILPRLPGQAGRGSPGVDRIETPVAGSATLLELKKDLEAQIERFVVGQQGSSRSETSGMGTHDTIMQENTQYKLTCSDAEELSETLTGSPREPGLLSTIQRYTFPDAGFRIRHVFDVDKPNPGERLEAAKTIVGMGGELKESEVLAAAGFSKPDEDDETLGGKEQLMQLAQMEADAKGAAAGGKPGEKKPGASGEKPAEKVVASKPGHPDRYGREAGHWITIGGNKGEDGKRHGGSPVFIENGRITKGAPGLTGKSIKGSGTEPPEHTHRQQLAQGKSYDRAVIRKAARKEGIDPKHLDQLAAEMKAHDSEFARSRKELLKAAQDTAKGMLTDLRAVTTNIQRGNIEEPDQIKHLDVIAEGLAERFPEHFHGHDDPRQRLYDLLAEGNPQPMSEHDAYLQAMDHLRDHRPEPVDDVPFVDQFAKVG